MIPLLAAGRPGSAMGEEYENEGARVTEAREAVERWEAEGGAHETGHPPERAPDLTPGAERTLPPAEPGEGTRLCQSMERRGHLHPWWSAGAASSCGCTGHVLTGGIRRGLAPVG